MITSRYERSFISLLIVLINFEKKPPPSGEIDAHVVDAAGVVVVVGPDTCLVRLKYYKVFCMIRISKFTTIIYQIFSNLYFTGTLNYY